jgi:hypothetical protein
MDLGAPAVARPSSRWKWCSQPKVRSTTQGGAEVGAMFSLATGDLRAVSNHASTPRTRSRRYRAFSHARRASNCDHLESSIKQRVASRRLGRCELAHGA